jgi:anti-sigma B factor antagonist
MSPFSVTIVTKGDTTRVHVVTLAGRLDAAGLPVFQQRLGSITTRRALRVVFDLGSVSFIGSAGIGLFLSFVEEVRDAEGDVRFVNVPSGIVSILSLLNVLDFLQQSDSEAEAIEELTA